MALLGPMRARARARTLGCSASPYPQLSADIPGANIRRIKTLLPIPDSISPGTYRTGDRELTALSPDVDIRRTEHCKHNSTTQYNKEQLKIIISTPDIEVFSFQAYTPWSQLYDFNGGYRQPLLEAYGWD